MGGEGRREKGKLGSVGTRWVSAYLRSRISLGTSAATTIRKHGLAHRGRGGQRRLTATIAGSAPMAPGACPAFS